MSRSITITPEGSINFIYGDDLNELLAEGSPTVTRASHVEPDSRGQWVADLSPVSGPSLGPFKLRSEALAAEVAWLEEHGY
jgi:hypothetical protein